MPISKHLRELKEGEKEKLLGFFAQSLMVIDMNEHKFDQFAAEKIGVSLCSKYGLLASESLKRFVGESGHAEQTLQLFVELCEYYRKQYPNKVNDGSERARQFAECEAIVKDAVGFGMPILPRLTLLDAPEVVHIKELLDGAYEELNRGKFPSAYTKAKSALEGALRWAIMLLDKEPDDKREITGLWGRFKSLLAIRQNLTSLIDKDKKISGMGTILSEIANSRNEQSDSHGRSTKDDPINPVEARLFVNCAMTLTEFVISKTKEVV